jgi:hypothetical protein
MKLRNYVSKLNIFFLLIINIFLYADNKNLNLLVLDLNDNEVVGIEIGIELGFAKSVTNSDGVATLDLGFFEPGQQIKLKIFTTLGDKEFEIISPWNRIVNAPSSKIQSPSYITIVVALKGLRENLKDPRARKQLVKTAEKIYSEESLPATTSVENDKSEESLPATTSVESDKKDEERKTEVLKKAIDELGYQLSEKDKLFKELSQQIRFREYEKGNVEIRSLKLTILGRAQLQYLYNSNIGSNEARTNNGFNIRRGQLYLSAKINSKIQARLSIDVGNNGALLKDIEGLISPLFDNYYFRFGQFKVPVWREEYKRSSGSLLLIERSTASFFLFENFLSGRNIGLEFGGRLNRRTEFAVNFSNGAG